MWGYVASVRGSERVVAAASKKIAIGDNYSVSIFTSPVILRQVSICCASQTLASASDAFGTILKVCFLNAELASGVCSDAIVASKIACKICFGVPAGANKACQAIVPTPGTPE